MNTKKKLVKKAFTLVELIIVIAIIAILAVTAFLLLTKWLSKARDSSRASNLANIEKSLQISLTDKSSLPKPDSYTLIYASGASNVIGYQGYFGDGVKDAVGNINSAPKDGDDYFTYYLNADLNKYQLAGFLENTTAYNSNVVNAVDYSGRFVTVKGDKLGLLTDANKSPLQTLGLTGLDLLTGNTSYIAYFNNSDNVSGTGKQLFTYYYNQTKSLLQNKDLAKNDSSLVFYSDMETVSGSKLWDFSQYGNSGTCYNFASIGTCGQTSGPLFDQGIRGKALKFNGTGDLVKVMSNTKMKPSKEFTVSLSFKTSILFTSGQNYYHLFQNGQNWSDGKGINIRQQSRNPGEFAKYFAVLVFTGTLNSGKAKYDDFVEINEWENVIVKYDGKEIYIYKDGKLVNKTNYGYQGDILNDALDINIGAMTSSVGTAGGAFFNGLIDEVRMYDRALSDDEVKALYTAN